ncbi:inhibitor of growth protein 5-like [Engraulis encrasicolus]|uniref:inhibitor of growth protein 5-like n=1 Tax=Engraulis encrasicolus TaxID=184585 RepID=UPI002FD19BC7
MATAMYLEQYLDSIEGLPFELQRNFSLMRELDNRTQEQKTEIDNLAEDYIASVKELAPEQRVHHLQKIENAYSKCREYSDDKVQLAVQIYEMVDKHIRRLDADLARFENDLKKDSFGSSSQESSDEKRLKRDKTVKVKKTVENNPISKKLKSSVTESLLAMHPADVLDMPVDPNEPTYCLCSQVSYGEMIGCDNLECPTEWFHFACVGLATKPKGKWYCPSCVKDMRKK